MSSDAIATSQFGLDLFGNTALTPADLAPVGLLRIPMKENPVARDESEIVANETGISRCDDEGQGFRLAGDRDLARGWKHRALDNIAAIRLAARSKGRGVRPLRKNRPSSSSSAPSAAPISRSPCSAVPARSARAGKRSGRPWRGWCPRPRLAGLTRATQYAHFTPEYIVRAIWQAVAGFGFAGGRVLEPGCGTGLFIASSPSISPMPAISPGVEADPITAKIARPLYPDSTIRARGFHQGAGSRMLRPGDRQSALLRSHRPAARGEGEAFALAS